MLIDCPGCAKSYHIIKAALGPNGRRVACPRCDAIWFVAPEANEYIQQPRTATVTIHTEDIKPLRKAVAKVPPRPPTPLPRSPVLRELCAGVVLLVAGMAVLGFRTQIVRFSPPASALYAALGLPVNLRGLELCDLHTVSTREGSEPVLGIEGEITNVRDGPTLVPPIELTIRDADGHDLYSWTATSQKRLLAAGENILFRAQLAEPPPGGHDVLARFAATEPKTVAWQ
jgi:predicted Zn finger-like uncharacterized protein